MRYSARIVQVSTALMFLSGCMAGAPNKQAAGGISSDHSVNPGPVAGTTGNVPVLPRNYRRMAAIYVVREFNADAVGPPEISEPTSHAGPFGGFARAFIRFPVSEKTASRTSLTAMFGATGQYYRCAAITAYSGISSLGKTEIYLKSNRIDSPECAPSLKYTRYTELEELAAKCRIPGAPCRGEPVVAYEIREKRAE